MTKKEFLELMSIVSDDAEMLVDDSHGWYHLTIDEINVDDKGNLIIGDGGNLIKTKKLL